MCPGVRRRIPEDSWVSRIPSPAADDVLSPGQTWIQESIIGSRYVANFDDHPHGIVPRLTGRAFVCSEAVLHHHDADPYRQGIARAASAPPDDDRRAAIPQVEQRDPVRAA